MNPRLLTSWRVFRPARVMLPRTGERMRVAGEARGGNWAALAEARAVGREAFLREKAL